jgi:hypothetical protein
MTAEPEADGPVAFDRSLRGVPFSDWSEEQREAYVHDTARRAREVQLRQRMVLHILECRGIPVTIMASSRVRACVDPELLWSWALRAFQVSVAADVFTPERPD